jgi:protein involved in polysaccharide export with SLBB domain
MKPFAAILHVFIICTVFLGVSATVRAGEPHQAQPPIGIPSTEPIAGPIRPNDTIRILVAGNEGQPLSGDYRVEPDGTITTPRLGMFTVADKMQADLANEVKKRITDKKLLKQADVTVYIIARRAREVTINGAVSKQGVRIIKDNATLSEALEEAEIAPGADLTRVEVIRKDLKSTVNYQKFRIGESNDPQYNPKLEDGDKIFVYAGTPTTGTIRVNGEVKDSTKVILPLIKDLTVGQVLQQVGGITDFADRNGIVIRRQGFTLAVPYDDIMRNVPGKDIRLQDKDEVYIPRLERPRQFTVSGAVTKGSTFPLTTKTNLLQAIASAGGLSDGARRDMVEIQRTDAAGNITKKKYNLEKGTDAAVEIVDGDLVFVPYPKRPSNALGTVATVVGVLSGIVILFTQLR